MRRPLVITVSILLLTTIYFSCEKQEENIPFKGIIDERDGKEYDTVRIGDQTWFAENLAYLPTITLASEAGYNSGYFVYGYDGNSNYGENLRMYGVLYNQWSMQQDVCPAGWHVPDDGEWEQLIEYLGGVNEADSKLKDNTGTWKNLSSYTITNESGFSALPGGELGASFNFRGLGDYGGFWSSTKLWGSYQRDYLRSYIILYGDSDSVEHHTGVQVFGTAYSVRCVKDSL